MTYMLNGKQYIVLAIGGQGYPGELLAFSLGSRIDSQGFFCAGTAGRNQDP